MNPAPAEVHSAITDLLHRYCRYTDTRAFGLVGDLFLPDGTLDLTGTPVHGPDAIARLVESRALVPSLHVPSGEVVDMLGPKEARVHSCVLVFRASAGAQPAPFPVALPVAVAAYEDLCRHDGTRWRFRSRKSHVFMR